MKAIRAAGKALSVLACLVLYVLAWLAFCLLLVLLRR